LPFAFIPCSGSTTEPKPGPMPTRVRALEDRIACEITFPRLLGYRYDLPGDRLSANFTDESRMALSTIDIPTKVQLDPIVGESSEHTLDDLKRCRPQEVSFLLAKLVLEKYFRDDDGNIRHWLFPQILHIAQKWLSDCVTLRDNTFPQLLLLIEFAHDAADRIYKAIVQSNQGEKSLKPILRPYDTVGSTRYVDFDTIRAVYPTDPKRCHVSHVVADTESWEQKMAQALEELGEEGLVLSYVKNQNLGFSIPYTVNGEEHNYLPDFIIRIRHPSPQVGESPLSSPSPSAGEGWGEGENIFNLIIEVTGKKDKDKTAKVDTARTLWVPAVNNHGGFGRWAFLEIADPWDAKNIIRSKIKSMESMP